ncbi:MAG: SAM-dependent chlorinase/fluorinase, partial [Mycobacteriales bacterium]
MPGSLTGTPTPGPGPRDVGCRRALSGKGAAVPYLTFLSDYGLEDSFVGVCKGVIARTAPEVRVIDVCHQILAQDVAQAAITLAA